jgi:hypothetical protein
MAEFPRMDCLWGKGSASLCEIFHHRAQKFLLAPATKTTHCRANLCKTL